MKALAKHICNTLSFRETVGHLQGGRTPVAVIGTGSASRALFCYALCEEMQAPALVLVQDDEMAKKAMADLQGLFSSVRYFPARDIDFFSNGVKSRNWECTRLETLLSVGNNSCDCVVATPEALLQATVLPEKLQNATFTLKIGERVNREDLLCRLIAGGYTRAELIEGKGQFAVRGGILDIFPTSMENPIRLELWDDEIDSLGTFDITTQRRTENVESVTVTPALELGLDEPGKAELKKKLTSLIVRMEKRGQDTTRLKGDLQELETGFFTGYERYQPLMKGFYGNFFDYSFGFVCFLWDETKISDHLKSYYALLQEDLTACVEKEILPAECVDILPEREVFYLRLKDLPTVYLDSFSHSYEELKPRGITTFVGKQLSGFAGNLEQMTEDVRGYLTGGFSVLLGAENKHRLDTLSAYLQEREIACYLWQGTLQEGKVGLVQGVLSSGLEITEEKIAFLCDGDTVKTRTVRQKKAKNSERIKSYNDLHIGDYVVHATHGVALYQGIEKLTVQGVTKDYIKLKYAGTDVLYIPTNQLDMISKYVSADSGIQVKLNRIGSPEWAKTKSRVKKAVADMAEELLSLYAARESVKGFAFSPDTEWQKDFEGHFPYQETEDQLRSVEEIKRDMEKPSPMDRLLCGDVGFGKTEVALRAVFKCVSDGKQAAILVPTTILAWQHYETTLKRFQSVPVNIEVLSRARTKKEQEEILRKVRRGEVDILIGTHRLLQKDVEFKKLGLVVVDEEQRFGVAHKERLKEITKEVDVLTLSATPIPRTLNMALSGIRDMSLLEEPPKERQTVATYVLEHENSMIIEAIRQELRRNGQVLYLHNSIETIESCATKLQRELPDARIAYAHGKMSETELSEIWQAVVAGEIDVLVCTTIIETGIDLPNANTLIIENADRLGLSQLYQLRGRVGRSHRRAYCYLTYRKGKVLTEDAERRLSAIKEFTEFGSGFKIAMRDLEIRGAGNVLGAEQHGHMEAVGYDLYVQMLENAVREQKGEEVLPDKECVFDLDVSAHIPFEYIESGEQRIDIYKKIATLSTEEDYYDICDELVDRFGEIPEVVDTLCRVSLIRNLGTKARLNEITEDGGRVVFHADEFRLEKLSQVAEELSGRMTFIPSHPPVVKVLPKRGNSLMDEAQTFLTLYLG